MAYTSQFTVYSSADASHPILTGNTSGSLLNILNKCLITGYGSKVGAGWTKTGSIGPANGLAIPDINNCGIFVMPTGSKATLFISDTGISAGNLREARATGFDYVTGFSASLGTPTVSGSNQFPTVAQLAIGAVAIRKSLSVDATERQWIAFADSSSIYLFIATGDLASTYMSFCFGDIYSLKVGSNDLYKCIITGNNNENTNINANFNTLDFLSAVNTSISAHFMQRSFGGTGGSITVGKHGDGVKGSTSLLLGVTQYPNGPNNGTYISPVWVHENLNSNIRGIMRGFWHLCHPIAGFSDGQIIIGSDDYSGKTFQVIKQSPSAGMYLMETSATLPTN